VMAGRSPRNNETCAPPDGADTNIQT